MLTPPEHSALQSPPLLLHIFQHFDPRQTSTPELQIRMSQQKLAAILFTSVLASIAACDKSPSGPDPKKSEPGIQIVAGANLADTVQTTPVQALIARIIDQDGKPKSGMVVRFESVLVGIGYSQVPTVSVGAVVSNSFGNFAVDTTDTEGRASVRVRLGTRAGSGGVVVSVPTLRFEDTAKYTIHPGAAAKLVSAPKDTAVYIGRNYNLRVATVDRYGNPRTDTVTYSVSSGPVSVNSGSNTLSPSAVGRGIVIAQAQGLSDTSFVSVVPQGSLAASRIVQNTGQAAEVVMFNLDGSGYRRLATTSVPGWFTDMAPRWNSTGTHIIYHDGGHEKRLFVADTLGSARRLITTAYPIVSETWAQYSRDGSWIYYSGRPGHQNNSLWRVRVDGSSPEQIGPKVGFYDVDSNPSPSPDGKRLVYVTNRAYPNIVLRILDIESGAVTALDIPGATPIWSPQGDRIGFEAYGEIKVVNANGSGQRIVSQVNRKYNYGIDWSPDGDWIAARSSTGRVIDLIHVESGLTLPLPFTGSFEQPTWRPLR